MPSAYRDRLMLGLAVALAVGLPALLPWPAAVELHDQPALTMTALPSAALALDKVTPRVNDSGAVQLDIAQEVSGVTPTTTSGINSPTIQQRRLATTISTRSGQMIALGGLISSTGSRTRSGFPLLSQIPLIGAAFGTHRTTNDRIELIILITPTVIRSPPDVDATVADLIDRMGDLKPLIDQGRGRPINVPPPSR